MNKLTTVGISLGVIFIGYIAYENLVAIPREKIEAQEKKEQMERTQALLEKARKEEQYNNCMNQAYADYQADWNLSCTTAGKGNNCSLYAYQAEDHDETLERKRDRCVTMYK